jgi:hypothetical protein
MRLGPPWSAWSGARQCNVYVRELVRSASKPPAQRSRLIKQVRSAARVAALRPDPLPVTAQRATRPVADRPSVRPLLRRGQGSSPSWAGADLACSVSLERHEKPDGPQPRAGRVPESRDISACAPNRWPMISYGDPCRGHLRRSVEGGLHAGETDDRLRALLTVPADPRGPVFRTGAAASASVVGEDARIFG